ncbi:MAG TPA: LCP family protein, partial [Caldilineaceae bacterium]|nr:LCP family protein [Caldilineaceae bacterium]
MSVASQENRSTKTKKWANGLPPGRWGVAAVILYSLVTLVVALSVSYWLYDWARLRILNSSSVAELADWNVLLPGNLGEGAGQSDDAAIAGEAAGAPSEENSAQPAVTVPAINVLLLGTDARPDESAPPRTDTMILLTFDPQRQSLGMLSLPRDLWVPIPGYGYEAKINTAYSLGETYGYAGGGAQLAKDTVSSFIGQPVQYYARVNFQGFVELIDLIGGIDVVVPATIHDEQFPTDDYGVTTFHLEAGAQHLDG